MVDGEEERESNTERELNLRPVKYILSAGTMERHSIWARYLIINQKVLLFLYFWQKVVSISLRILPCITILDSLSRTTHENTTRTYYRKAGPFNT
jgi:hypothetical protein